MQDDFVLAHLSDVHLGPLPVFWPRHWTIKRILGFVNWHRSRRFVHRLEALVKLTDDLATQKVDHIAVTGDLANIGLPRELSAGLDWLQTLGDARHVTVIPGNHDIYSKLKRDPGIARWAAFMSSFGDGGPIADHASGTETVAPDHFPFVRRFGPIALVGVNSAVPTPAGYATGFVDDGQLGRLRRILGDLEAEGAIRVVLIHHPPLPGQASRRRALTNAEVFEQLLEGAGADLVLHGHNHRNMLAWRTSQTGARFPVVGAPSASFAKTAGSDRLARYNLYRLPAGGGAIEMVGRGLRTTDGTVEELERRLLVETAADAA